MKTSTFALGLTLGITSLTASSFGQQQTAGGPYKLIQTEKVGGAGGFDYVFADVVGRRLYIPRSGQTGRVTVFDLDTLKSVGEVPNTKGVHGVAVDPKSGHGFSSSNPVVMFDTKTLETLKSIQVQGSPDGILFDPATEHVFVLSHRAPNVTVLNATDGAIVGTIDLGGAPEQGASDEAGHVYIDLEDKGSVAVVDSKAMKVTAHYDLGGKGGTPAGLALDAKNHVLFVCCRNPQVAVIINAEDGKIITTVPIGNGVDAAEFNPATMEAFSSQRDGTLTVIRENSPTAFEVEQTVQTKPGAKTSTLDSKTNRILLITAETAPAPAATVAGQGQAGQGGQDANGRRGGRGGRGGQFLPDSFSILVVGK
jgi:DNA-binding beta-propeller fold protein YncE